MLLNAAATNTVIQPFLEPGHVACPMTVFLSTNRCFGLHSLLIRLFRPAHRTLCLVWRLYFAIWAYALHPKACKCVRLRRLRGSLCSGARQRQEPADLWTGSGCFRGNVRVDTQHADSAGLLSTELTTSRRSRGWVDEMAFPYMELSAAHRQNCSAALSWIGVLGAPWASGLMCQLGAVLSQL